MAAAPSPKRSAHARGVATRMRPHSYAPSMGALALVALAVFVASAQGATPVSLSVKSPSTATARATPPPTPNSICLFILHNGFCAFNHVHVGAEVFLCLYAAPACAGQATCQAMTIGVCEAVSKVLPGQTIGGVSTDDIFWKLTESGGKLTLTPSGLENCAFAVPGTALSNVARGVCTFSTAAQVCSDNGHLPP